MSNKSTVMKTIQDKFIGTWHLVHWEVQTEDGKHHNYPYGEKAKGSIIYTQAGRMSAQLMQLARPSFEIAHSWKGTPEETKAAFRGYTAYGGTFKIVDNTVVHQVDMSLFPNWLGTDLVRIFEFQNNGNHLRLSTPLFQTRKGQSVKQVLLWEKL